MVALNQASIYHWLQRPDCDNRRLSVGYWQASRIQVLTGNASAALRCAEDALAYACDLSPFYTAYAHEAVARAARLGGDENRVQEHLAQAQALAAQVSDPAEREMLLKDLGTV